MEDKFKRVLELYYGEEKPWGALDVRKEDAEVCKIYMRMVYFSWKTMYKNTPIPQTLQELEKWENENLL